MNEWKPSPEDKAAWAAAGREESRSLPELRRLARAGMAEAREGFAQIEKLFSGDPDLQRVREVNNIDDDRSPEGLERQYNNLLLEKESLAEMLVELKGLLNAMEGIENRMKRERVKHELVMVELAVKKAIILTAEELQKLKKEREAENEK